jgi:hypothetical protein
LSDETRTAYLDALGAHLADREAAGASGQDPGGVDNTGLLDAAQAHVDGLPPLGDLQAEFERLRDDPAADPAERNAAEEAFGSARQATRILQGRPLATGTGA